MPHQKSQDGWLSVTEVLSIAINKPFLYYWAGKNGLAKCEQIKRESQEIGTEVHSIIESRFKEGDNKVLLGNSGRMVNNFWNKFVIPYDVKATQLEVTFKDPKLKLQGTFDAFIASNKGPAIADWKTSNSLDKIGVPLQLAAYLYLSKLPVQQGVVVRIDKETDAVQTVWYEDLTPYWKIFRKCLAVARYVKFGIE